MVPVSQHQMVILHAMNEMDKKKIRSTIHFYDGFSEKYDKKYSAYLDHTHKQLLSHIGDVSGERILDISCGTGLLAEQLISRFSDLDLVLNDPSNGMRSLARTRLKGKASVKFSDQPAEEITFGPNSFDRVICLNSFHYYANQKKAIQSMYDVMKPGGTLHVLDWNRESWFHLPNLIISALSRENINTRSLREIKEMFGTQELSVRFEKKWSYRFWKFYLVEGEK